MSGVDEPITALLASVRALLLEADALVTADTEYLREEIGRFAEQVDILLAKVEKEDRMKFDKATLLA